MIVFGVDEGLDEGLSELNGSILNLHVEFDSFSELLDEVALSNAFDVKVIKIIKLLGGASIN